MKTTRLILLSFIYFLGFCNPNFAQNPSSDPNEYIELSTNNQTYVYDTLMGILQNKNNHIYKIVENYHCYFSVSQDKSYFEFFDKVFSEKRKKELKGTVLPLIFYCDSSGNILEMSFKIRDISKFSIEELNALENLFLKYKFEIINACPEKKYYLITTPYKGWL